MKKLFLTLAVFLLASTFGFAQEWVGVNKSTPIRIQESLVSSSENEIVIDVKVGGFYKDARQTPNGEQFVINATDMAAMLVKGAPDLPMYPISMIIGDNAKMEVSVVKSNYVDFENIEVAPSKGNFSRQINPNDVEYVYGEMYQQDAFYPAQQAALEAPYILRDFRGQNVMVYPYAYNPVTKTLRVYTEMRLAVKKVSDEGENVKASRRSNVITLDPETQASYERRFINFNQQSKYDFLVDEGEMLVVCVDEYMEALQTLVDWKNISGRPTTMVPVSETGIQQQLKTYIENYYASNPNLRYILLVGEHNNLPGMNGYSTSGGRSDNFYGMLEGNDYYEEVFVGRLSVNSAEDAAHQVSKIVYYERDIDETAAWLSRGVGIGADEGQGHYGEIDYEHMDFVRDTLLHYTYTEVSQHYAYVNNPSAQNMITDFSTGASIANYCNHGSPDGWAVANFSNSHVHQLTNDNRLPFIWSVACNNGEFSYGECFAEAWMRAKNSTTSQPTGAIGGMFSWISQPWQPPMYGQDEMVTILAEWRPGYRHTLGGASLNGNMYVLDMSPSDMGDTHNTWILFGDPSMMVRTKAPESMGVSANPAALLLGMTEMTVNADADFGIATLSQNGEVLASAYIEDGSATLQFEALSNVGTAQLVVLGYNKVTEIIDIEIVPADGAYLVFNSFELNQEDGQADYNEEIELTLSVKNVGTDPASDVNVEISTESEYVVITDNAATIAAIEGDETVTLDKAFAFGILPNAPNGEKITFNVKCSDAENTWESTFKVAINAPVFELSGLKLEGELVPGGVGTIEVTVNNVGNSKAYNVLTEFFGSSSDIVVENAVVETEELEAGESVTVSTEFEIGSSAMLGSLYEMYVSASAGYNVATVSTQFGVGSVLEDFETGDFSSYPWTFESQGGSDWVINSTDAYEGSYCAQSGGCNDSGFSKLKLQAEVLASGEFSFYVKVSSESYYDKLVFVVDNVEVGNWSGEVNWEFFTMNLEAGTHNLEWRYIKDYSYGSGEDCAWIDYISFPPVSVITSLDPVAGLVAEVDNDNVTVSWEAMSGADEYFVNRDGVQVAAQTGTSFTETLEEGVYTYNVIARNGNKYSAPAFVAVKVGTTIDVIEIEDNKVVVYPNPATDVLNVKVDTSFDATIYNYQGQVVMRNYNSNGQINVAELSSGVYFLEVRTDDNVSVTKIVIE
ncbi:MAG: T9SS type A sorting domain-containing protein [Bacteroidales bacterium]|nr:T9SS type A sorting domain-containing protein [Bacteroidales bacterium]